MLIDQDILFHSVVEDGALALERSYEARASFFTYETLWMGTPGAIDTKK